MPFYSIESKCYIIMILLVFSKCWSMYRLDHFLRLLIQTFRFPAQKNFYNPDHWQINYFILGMPLRSATWLWTSRLLAGWLSGRTSNPGPSRWWLVCTQVGSDILHLEASLIVIFLVLCDEWSWILWWTANDGCRYLQKQQPTSFE